MKTLYKISALAALLLGSSAAQAQYSACESSLEYYISMYGLEYAMSEHPECFSAKGTVALDQIRSTSVFQILAISNAVGSRFATSGPTQLSMSNSKGMAAGNGSKWFVWSSMSPTTELKYSHNGFKTDSDNFSGNLGADYQIAPNMVVGLSLSFDSGDSKASNNNGFFTTTSNIDTSGITLAPYFGWQITPQLTLDVSAGLGQGKLEQDNAIKADSDRYFAAANLSYTQWLGKWQFSGKGGYLYATEKYEDMRLNGNKVNGTDATNRLGQVRLGGQVAYWVTGGVMPYLGLTYTHDVERTSVTGQPWDKSAMLATLGVNAISLKEGLTVGMALNKEFMRSKSNNQSLVFNLNLRF